MNDFKVISFYTPDWDYPKYADLLRKDCLRLDIDHSIVEKTSAKNYVDNCNIKPFFIKESLEQYQCPVMWVDVDTTINRLPEQLIDESIRQFDLAVYRDQHIADKVYVNSIWFNYTQATLKLVEKWCEIIARSIDDAAFNQSLKLLEKELKVLVLPAFQHRILSWHYHPVPNDGYFVHRLSNSNLKREYKHRVERK